MICIVIITFSWSGHHRQTLGLSRKVQTMMHLNKATASLGLFYGMQGELFEILEDDKQLPEAQVQAIAKQLVSYNLETLNFIWFTLI